MDQLNPGIRKVVALLRSWGYNTVDSGDGKTHDYECDRDYPYVSMTLDRDDAPIVEADILMRRLRDEYGIVLQPVDESAPCLQLSYDPANGLCILDLMNVCDATLWPEE